MASFQGGGCSSDQTDLRIPNLQGLAADAVQDGKESGLKVTLEHDSMSSERRRGQDGAARVAKWGVEQRVANQMPRPYLIGSNTARRRMAVPQLACCHFQFLSQNRVCGWEQLDRDSRV
jgi:hypothetical protein